jgi:hypothetical protein
MSDVAAIETPGLGHNLPPLAEQLAEETAPFRERATALIQSVNDSRIDSAETEMAVTTLGTMLRDLREKVEEARKARAKPVDEQKDAIQAAFKRAIIDPVDQAMNQCRRMLDAYRAAEQKRAAEEAAKAQREAEEAARQAEQARAAGDIGAAIKAEMAEVQARDRAGAATDAAIRPDTMVRVQSGAAVAATQRVPVVVDIGACLRWLIVHQGPALVEAITPMIARLVRAKVSIPGVEVETRQVTQFRR